jgi:tetratricopeptide (TPR) repeat protein
MRYLSILFCFLILFTHLLFGDDNEARYCLEKGKVQYKEEMYTFAQEYLERAIKLDPKLFEAANYLGEIALLRKKKNEAYYYFDISLSIKEDQDAAHTRAGELADYFHKDAKAIAHFSRAIELNPGNSLAYLGASRCLSLSGNIQKAEDFFNRANIIKKEESEPLVIKGNASYKKKNFAQASAYYKEALRVNPAQTELYFTLASIERIRNNPDSAVEAIRQLSFLRPHDYAARIYLAKIYYSEKTSHNKRKDLESALLEVKEAISIKGDDPDFYEIAGEICDALGDTDTGSAYREKSEELKKKKMPTSP